MNDKPVEKLVVERQKTHGDFVRNAQISQELKYVIYTHMDKNSCSKIHAEALDMICLKLSRIASGQADFAGHWEDIEGYARLARNACRK